MGQPFIQPEVLAKAVAPQQDVLVEADHVLEFMDERGRYGVLDAGRCVQTAQGPAGVGNNRIEDLARVATRECREQVAAVEVSPDVASRAGTRNEGVHLAGHEDDNDAVAVDVRFPPERGRVGRIQQRVEQQPQRIEIGGRERSSVGLVHAVLEHRDMGSHVAREGDHGRMRRTVGIAADLEDASVTHRRRNASERRRGLGLVEHPHPARQLPLGPPERQVKL